MKKILFSMCFCLLTGCMLIHKMDIEQGNIITEAAVDHLHRGMTESQVKSVLGTPLLMNTFNNNRMDYVYTYQPGHGKMTEKSATLVFRNGILQEIIRNNPQ